MESTDAFFNFFFFLKMNTLQNWNPDVEPWSIPYIEKMSLPVRQCLRSILNLQTLFTAILPG